MQKQQQKPIGILGGTFDPIHFGHLRMGIELCESLDLEKIFITPCYQPVHRPAPFASPEQRLAMLEHAIHNTPCLELDPREIERKSPSYSIDTLIEMRKEFPQTPLCLLLGIDAFLGFMKWHRYEEIFDFAHIIVAYRPQYQLPLSGDISELVRSRLQHDIHYIHKNLAGGILLSSITVLEISASEIRKIITENRNPRYLLPDRVYDYIIQEQIYNRPNG